MSNVNAFVQSEKLFEEFGEEHPDYARYEWECAVVNGETILGYWMWVQDQIEQSE